MILNIRVHSKVKELPWHGEPLPRGRHKLARPAVRSSQRERLLRAVVECVAHHGFDSTTVPMVVATIYAVFGIWKGLRFLFAGIAVAALTLIGFFFLPQYFLLWMAAVGGGSLMLVGVWLRKV